MTHVNLPWNRRLKAAGLVLALALPAAGLRAGTVLPPGFSEAQIADVANGTALAIADDGRVFVCEKTGALRVIQNNTLLPAPFMTLSVDSNGERGLLGITLDPDFAVNNYLYVYYTVPTAPIHNRVSRFTANGNVVLPGSELVLMDLDNLSAATNHNGGALHFGPDGKLYVAVGENATTSHSQTLANRLGKILRVNADAANSIPTDNPFYGTATGLNRSIWALGLRNPFTFAFHRLSGRMFINDVGGNGVNTTEEVNDGMAGANYGWPATEGDFVQASFPNYTRPFHAYNSGMTTDCAIIGASFYDPPVAQFPPAYQNLYFFGDWCGGWIRTLDPSTPLPLTTTVAPQNFATGANQPVDLAVDRSNGSLVYFRNNGNVVRISYTGSLAPYIGSQPVDLTVTAGGSAQFCVSAGGSPLPTLQWQRNGVDIGGATGTCYTLDPALGGDHLAQFRAVVSNANGSVTSTAATLYVTANTPPSPVIVSPTAGLLYSAGQNYVLAGSATDSEDGPIPPASLSWTVAFHHDAHVHPFYGPVTGSGSTINIPNAGETATNVWYRVYLSATDSGGLSTTVQRDLYPVLVTFTVQSAPVPLSLTVEGLPALAPLAVLSVNGMLREIGAVSPQSGYSFSNWSDGLGQTHFVTAAAGVTFTANYTAFTPTSSPTRTPTPTASSTSTRSPTPSRTPTATASPTPAGATITDLGFSWTPTQLTVTVGTMVTWSWVGTHDVRSDDSLFSSGPATTGGTLNYTFNTPGTYRYYCSLHGAPNGIGMSGIIYVLGGPTPTSSPSPTPSPSSTVTPSASPTPTATASATVSPSPTPSLSPSASPTASPSGTPSASPTPSPSASPTASPTSTPEANSPTATPTLDPATPTSTSSLTATETATPLPSPSATPSLTATESATPPPSPSATPSASPTASPTHTPGANSPTATPTLAPATPTASPSLTATEFATPLPSPSASPSLTATESTTPLPSPSASPSASPTASPTHTPGMTVPTLTPTPAPDKDGTLQILALQAWPQPDPRYLSVRLSGPADQVRLRLYSSALTLVLDLDLGPAPAGWSHKTLPPDWRLNTAKGLYFGRVEASRQDVKSAATKPVTFMLRP